MFRFLLASSKLLKAQLRNTSKQYKRNKLAALNSSLYHSGNPGQWTVNNGGTGRPFKCANRRLWKLTCEVASNWFQAVSSCAHNKSGPDTKWRSSFHSNRCFAPARYHPLSLLHVVKRGSAQKAFSRTPHGAKSAYLLDPSQCKPK